ncbi:MAG: hypothetical protein U0835_16280 [Isosphaeraceae bacterium]
MAGLLVASLWDGFDVAGLLGGSLLPAAALLATLLLAVASAVIPFGVRPTSCADPGYPDVY